MPSARFGPNAVFGDVARVVVRLRDGLLDAQEAGRARGIAGVGRIAHGRDAAGRRVDAVDVVDAADVQHADAFGEQIRREVDAGGAIEDHRRQRARRARDDFGIDEAFLRHDDGLLRVVAHVVDVDAVQRRRFLGVRIVAGDRSCTARCACLRSGGTATSSPAGDWCRRTAAQPSDSDRRATDLESCAHRSAARAPARDPACRRWPARRHACCRRKFAVSISTRSPPSLGAGERADQRQRAAVLHRARAQELNDASASPVAGSTVPVA